MGRYVRLGAVRTWYEEDGGEPPHEIPMDHTPALRQGLPAPSWRSCPAAATACSSTSPSSATGPSPSS
jgi:hypothetical protein